MNRRVFLGWLARGAAAVGLGGLLPLPKEQIRKPKLSQPDYVLAVTGGCNYRVTIGGIMQRGGYASILFVRGTAPKQKADYIAAAFPVMHGYQRVWCEIREEFHAERIDYWWGDKEITRRSGRPVF